VCVDDDVRLAIVWQQRCAGRANVSAVLEWDGDGRIAQV
jgi:hypothetical protein